MRCTFTGKVPGRRRAPACYNELTVMAASSRRARSRPPAASAPRRASSTSASRRWPAASIPRPTWRGSWRWPATAVARGAEIVCTQELFKSQYFCQTEDHRFFALAETIPGPSTDAFQAFAKKHGVVVVASLFEKRAAGLYHNTAAVIDADGSLLGIYRKMHIPDDPLFYEKFYFTPGDTGFRAWKTTLRHDRRAHLLGPVVSRGRAAHRAAGRRDPVLSDGHRLASAREGGVRRGPARRRGRSSSAATPWPTAASCAWPTASATSAWPAPTAGR